MRGYADAISRAKNREEAAKLYAAALSNYPLISPAWSVINDAVLQRWSLSGLQYIKREAWKRAGR